MDSQSTDTRTAAYAARLASLGNTWWKRLLNVQLAYQWNVRRHHLGRTLDVGCGVGRNLVNLRAGSVGVDHNIQAVEYARSRGLEALTPEEFTDRVRAKEERFDALLLAHVIEHMDRSEAQDLLRRYATYVRADGKVLMICPQERGYRSDPTHVRFTDAEDLAELARQVGLEPVVSYSFPFPRWVGRWFTYNETCVLAVVPRQ